jgi:hypothetical protein
MIVRKDLAVKKDLARHNPTLLWYHQSPQPQHLYGTVTKDLPEQNSYDRVSTELLKK